MNSIVSCVLLSSTFKVQFLSRLKSKPAAALRHNKERLGSDFFFVFF